MHISLVGCRESTVDFFPELGKALAKKISGVEVGERFVPFPDDLPVVALECAKESDFVFVFALLEDEAKAMFITEKLIDVELSSGTRILKAVLADDFSAEDEDDYIEKKNALVEEYSALILGVLFGESSFRPKGKDFSL